MKAKAVLSVVVWVALLLAHTFKGICQEGKDIELIHSVSMFKNATKIVASQKGKLIYVLQEADEGTYPEVSAKLFALKIVKEEITQIDYLRIPDSYDITLGFKDREVFVLTKQGEVVRCELSKNDRWSQQLQTTGITGRFDKGSLVIHKATSSLFLSMERYSPSQSGRQAVIKTFQYQPEKSSLTLNQEINKTNHSALEGASDMLINANFLYVTSRHERAIQVFEIDAEGQLTYRKNYRPKQFHMRSSQKHILAIDAENRYAISAATIWGQSSFFNMADEGTLELDQHSEMHMLTKEPMAVKFSGRHKAMFMLNQYGRLIIYKGVDTYDSLVVKQVSLTPELSRQSRDLMLLEDQLYILSARSLGVFNVNFDRRLIGFKAKKKGMPMDFEVRNVYEGVARNSPTLDSTYLAAERAFKDLEAKMTTQPEFKQRHNLFSIIRSNDYRVMGGAKPLFKSMAKVIFANNEKLSDQTDYWAITNETERMKFLASHSAKMFSKMQEMELFWSSQNSFDPVYVAKYTTEAFDSLRDKYSSREDSTHFVSDMTNVYNALYTYYKDLTAKFSSEQAVRLRPYLMDLQLRVKGAQLSTDEIPITWSDLRDNLSDDEVAIDIVRFNSFDFDKTNLSDSLDVNYYAYIIDNKSEYPKLFSLNIDYEEEIRFLNRLQSRSRNKSDLMQYIQNSDVKAWFWTPIEKELKGKSRVYFCPDGIFHQFPIEAIKYDNSEFVSDKFDIIRVMNLSNVVGLKQQASATPSRAILVGNPAFNLSRNVESETSPIPETEEEVNFISKSLARQGWEVATLTGEQATEKEVKKISAPKVLHIATHGAYKARGIKSPFESFSRSYLKLAGVDNKKAEDLEDGKLDGSEVVKMDLENTDLVVLSACETGIGSTINAEGMMGISRAFQIAGAQSVLATLWKVDSEVTVRFMKVFYNEIGKGKHHREAFQLARQAIKEESDGDVFFWAGYIMIN